MCKNVSVDVVVALAYSFYMIVVNLSRCCMCMNFTAHIVVEVAVVGFIVKIKI